MMGELPEKFPEYAIMYKTLSNQIKILKKRKQNAQEIEIDEIKLKIQNYHLEQLKIKNMFPDYFFDEN